MIIVAMALAGRQVQYAQDDGVRIGRVVDTVVDPNSGVAAQRERIGVAVPTKKRKDSYCC